MSEKGFIFVFFIFRFCLIFFFQKKKVIEILHQQLNRYNYGAQVLRTYNKKWGHLKSIQIVSVQPFDVTEWKMPLKKDASKISWIGVFFIRSYVSVECVKKNRNSHKVRTILSLPASNELNKFTLPKRRVLDYTNVPCYGIHVLLTQWTV